MTRPLLRGATFLFLTASCAFALEWDTVSGNSTADGGSGYWDLTTPNWFNGSSNVLWDSGSAVFGANSGPYAILRGAIHATALTLTPSAREIMIVADPGGDPYGDTLIPVGLMPISGQFARIEAPITGPGGLDILSGATLSANNTYTGGTHVRSGVTAYSLSAFGSGDVTLHPNTSVIYYSAGAGTISNNFTAEGDGADFRSIFFAPGQILSGNFNLQSSLQIYAGYQYGPIYGTDFTGIFNGSSTATLAFSFYDTFSERNVARLTANSPFPGSVRMKDGTLMAGPGAGLPNAHLSLESNVRTTPAILAGVGTFGAVDFIGSQNHIAPGNGGIGTLTIGTLGESTIAGYGGIFDFELGPTSDQLVVNGTVDLGSGSWVALQLSAGFAPKEGDTFFLLSNDGSNDITGTFANFGEGTDFFLGGYILRGTYLADAGSKSFIGGNDFAVKVVPEPGSAWLLASALAVLPYRRNRSVQTRVCSVCPTTL